MISKQGTASPAPSFQSGDPGIERLYRTHWVSPALSEKKRERLAEKASRAPELVIIQPLDREWTCHNCGGSGGLLIMENPGPSCRAIGNSELESPYIDHDSVHHKP